MAREADSSEEPGGPVDNWFLHDGPFEPPLYRIKRAPPDKIQALRASRAAVLARAARRKLDAAMKRGGMPQEPKYDDEGMKARVNSRRIAEILAPHRREFNAMDPDEQERFMETIRLFASERMKLSEWRAVSRAACERYQAGLPTPEPPGRQVKAKDRPSNPPQGW